MSEYYRPNIDNIDVRTMLVAFYAKIKKSDTSDVQLQVATVQSTVVEIFKVLDAKTSWGRNELKEIVNAAIAHKIAKLQGVDEVATDHTF